MIQVQSYAEGKWHTGGGRVRVLNHAVNGKAIAEVSSEGLDFKSMLTYGQSVGSKSMRRMTFHERARVLKALAKYLNDRRDYLYELSAMSGATPKDAWYDIDGGIGTFFVYSSKGRRELPDERFMLDGNLEPLSRNGTFAGHHILTPLQGVAVHINAYNFPCWGMMEKLAPTFLAGMAAIVKPASVTSYIAEAVVRIIIESGILPDGALQLISGSSGDLLDHVDGQDVVTFTGSASTGLMLKSTPSILNNSVRFNMEADSLNFSMLGPDVEPGSSDFDVFVKELAREMTTKAGQRCTAIRRIFVPEDRVDAVQAALRTRLEKTLIGDPSNESVRMGPLVSRSQVEEVASNVAALREVGEVVIGGSGELALVDANVQDGAFFEPTVLLCNEPFSVTQPHDIEAFGPVSTLMPYKTIDDAAELARLGRGSLVGSVITSDPSVAREMVYEAGSYHGRLLILNSECAKESTGHGSPMPHLVHGGPGRAGGGEEMGGIRGVKHFMQTTAIQGTPTMLTEISNEWQVGSDRSESTIHPFRKTFDQIQIGDTLTTHRRTLTEADVVNFAGISGDYFYAHTDEIAAAESLFERRVAHGYFVLSAAAGLFVHPGEGPVLANYGLENLRFTQPVYPGDTIRAALTCRRKIAKEPREGEPLQGVVEWHVDVSNQSDELVATYTILTLVRRDDLTVEV
ncbi:MAG: phenylacetic acid degradation bifunctional protein PaaZ [Rhodothermales bacterium]|nr:phenylacetic acid degradation bifunctional protein PaaZ [Rhodothermales bacterium]